MYRREEEEGEGDGLTVCCFWMASSKSTLPRLAFVIRNCSALAHELEAGPSMSVHVHQGA